MLRLILLAAVLLLSACDLRPPRGTETGTQNLLRFHDDELAVTCWQVKNWDGIYCIPDAQLKPLETAAPSSAKGHEPRGIREIVGRFSDLPTATHPQPRIRL